MSDKLSDALWVEPKKREPEEFEDRLAESLQKALDKTTPERAGAPWDGEDKQDERRGYTIREGH
jgi:hypothetical protein